MGIGAVRQFTAMAVGLLLVILAPQISDDRSSGGQNWNCGVAMEVGTAYDESQGKSDQCIGSSRVRQNPDRPGFHYR